MKNKTFHKRKILVVFAGAFAMIFVLIGRLTYLMGFDAEYYQKKAEDLHERERDIKAARGEILDRNGKVLATNRTVCTISVIHSQIREAETVIDNLSELLEMNSSDVRKRVEKISSIERIKSNVDKKTGDKIRNLGMAGKSAAGKAGGKNGNSSYESSERGNICDGKRSGIQSEPAV